MERLINMEKNHPNADVNLRRAFNQHKKILIEEEKLQEHITIINNEIPYVDMRTYSHNIISMELNIISSIYGDDVAKAVIKFLNLDDLGW
tara:strand:+ start:207 stop:476 length:270 start_codon:yes stop_codon:yes gene_type:complete